MRSLAVSIGSRQKLFTESLAAIERKSVTKLAKKYRGKDITSKVSSSREQRTKKVGGARKAKLIACPLCAGQGHITDPVLQSSVVDTCCPVCQCTGKIELTYAVLDRFYTEKHEDGVLIGWETDNGHFVHVDKVESVNIPYAMETVHRPVRSLRGSK